MCGGVEGGRSVAMTKCSRAVLDCPTIIIRCDCTKVLMRSAGPSQVGVHA